ncbi:shikimate kinase [uncultured Jatrophihabitans sp.]|uniref:shikimate kinase n=1 Tax=uncultured Jatrophihabitans sp. TaxID=1610747 RepID=UPI0035CB79B0
MSPLAVLIGLPGVGKSTTGRRLAKIMSVAFLDSDDAVEAATGRTVRELFAHDGEAAFRLAETEAVVAALDRFAGVLALGGGALGSERTCTALRAAHVPVIRLQAELATLGRRIGDARTRPLLAAAPAERLAALAAERGPLYAELATLTVDTDGRSPGQVAATIAARLHERDRAATSAAKK